MKLFRKKDIRTEFLPSAIEIVETPEAPLGKFSIWIIFFIVIAAIIWSFGKVNEVAISRGKVIPFGNINVVQSITGGSVESIKVKEGDKVSKGQTIVILSDTELINEKSKLEGQLEVLKTSKTILNASKEGKTPNIDKEKIKQSQAIIKEQLMYNSTLEKIYSNELENEDISLDNLKEESNEIQKQLYDERKKLDELKGEVENLNAGKNQENKGEENQENKVEEQENQIQIQNKKMEIDSSQQTIKKLEENIKIKEDNVKIQNNKKSNYVLNHKQELEKGLIEILKSIESINKDIEKIDESISKLNIKSPVDGEVQKLEINTVGGVVQPAATIANIVPKNKELIVETMILNKDIGFVKNGQKTQVKFDTFGFQRYGSIEGTIKDISADAITVDNGSFYKAVVELNEKEIDVNGNKMKFSSGMDVTCEVDVGERRIIDFFIPGIKDIKNSFNLR